MVSLSLRSIGIHFFQAASVFFLARFLVPEDYGVFAVLNGWIGTLVFLTDIGMGGALTHAKREPSKKELESYIGMRLLLAIFWYCLLWALAPSIIGYYKLDPVAVRAVRVLACILPLSVISSVPRLLFQRNLNFTKTAQVDLLSSAALYFCQILFAYLGYSYWCFILAALIRATTDIAVSYAFARSFHLPKLHWHELKTSLAFGIPFQLQSIIPVSRAIVIPLILVIYLGMEEIGLIFWVVGLVSMPRIIAINYNQIIFPSVSRLRGDVKNTERLISRGTELMALIMSYSFGLGAACGTSLVTVLFPDRWASSKLVIPYAALAIGLSTYQFFTSSMLNAVGQPIRKVWLEVLSLPLELGGVALLVPYLGIRGYFVALSLANAAVLGLSLFWIRHWLTSYSIIRLIGLSVTALVSFFISHELGWAESLVFSFTLFTLAYLGIILVFDKRTVADILTLPNRVLELRS